MKITIESGEEAYRLVGPDGDEGDLVEYGLPAVLHLGGDMYAAYIEDPEAEDEEMGQHVYKLQPIEETEVVEVEFEEDEEGEEGEEVEESGSAV